MSSRSTKTVPYHPSPFQINALQRIESEPIIKPRASVSDMLRQFERKPKEKKLEAKTTLDDLNRLLQQDAERSQIGALQKERVQEEWAKKKDENGEVFPSNTIVAPPLRKVTTGLDVKEIPRPKSVTEKSAKRNSIMIVPSTKAARNVNQNVVELPSSVVQKRSEKEDSRSRMEQPKTPTVSVSPVAVDKKVEQKENGSLSTAHQVSSANVPPNQTSPTKQELLSPHPTLPEGLYNATKSSPSSLEPSKAEEEKLFSVFERQSKWTIPFAHIRLEEELSRGSSGRVFRGGYLETEVAIKCIRLISDDSIQRRQVAQEFVFLKSHLFFFLIFVITYIFCF